MSALSQDKYRKQSKGKRRNGYKSIPHAHPGYLFSNQVPPISAFLSYTQRSRFGIRCLNLTDVMIPEIPEPMTTTLTGRNSSIDRSSMAGSLLSGGVPPVVTMSARREKSCIFTTNGQDRTMGLLKEYMSRCLTRAYIKSLATRCIRE